MVQRVYDCGQEERLSVNSWEVRLVLPEKRQEARPHRKQEVHEAAVILQGFAIFASTQRNITRLFLQRCRLNCNSIAEGWLVCVLQLLDIGMRRNAVNQAGRDQGSEALCVHVAHAQPASKVTPIRKGIDAVVVVQDGANGILSNGRVGTLWVGSPVAEGMPYAGSCPKHSRYP